MQPGRIPRHREPPRRRRSRRSHLPPAAASLSIAALLLGACAASPEPVATAPSARVVVAGELEDGPDAVPTSAPRAANTAPRVARRTPASAPPPLPPAPRSRPSRRTDATAERLAAAFERARDLVERESGTDLSAVSLRLADDAAILAEVERETRRLVRGQLGDGPLAERLLSQLVRDQIGTYAALYSGRRRAVMVSREVLGGYLDSLPADRAVREEALLVLMLHELVHAADDRRHAIHADRALDFRASFAQSAAFEGHAQWMTRGICRREGCLGGLDALDAFMFGEAGAPAAADAVAGGASATGSSRTLSASTRPPAVDRNLLEYSYVEGERFVAALAARPNGAALIEDLLADPPHDPLQILDPASFPNEARESRNRALLDGALGVDHPWLGGPDARVAVATSPLKGVNLRGDPSRRAAAIDGFTRLVTAMVAVQFHDPGPRARPPIEVTLMRTDRATTARLFADTLHAHARLRGTDLPPDAALPPDAGSGDGGRGGDASGDVGDGDGDRARERRRAALQRTVLPTGGEEPWHTTIATDGPFVVQASGRAASAAPMDDYVLEVLAALLDGEPA